MWEIWVGMRGKGVGGNVENGIEIKAYKVFFVFTEIEKKKKKL